MLGFMSVLVVEMNKSPLDLGEEFKLLLQILSDVVGLLQGHVCWQDNVNLDEVVGPKRVGPDRVDVPDGLVVVPAEVCQLLQVFRCSGPSHEGVHVLQHG